MSEAWLALLYAARGERAWGDLLAALGSAAAVLGQSERKLAASGLGSAAIERLRRPDRERLASWRRWLEHPDHALVTLGSASYPRRLAEIRDPPLALWIDGTRPELLHGPQVAVVGSRNATRAGRATAEGLARGLSESGVTVTSGLAVGIDGAGHCGALCGPGGTVAVLGSGIDVLFPRRHAALACRIAAAGLLVSEYPPGVPPHASRFPARNRIIAGLSLGTLIVEAGPRSGSLITARLASEFGRDVFAVPGSIHSPLARGCHALIRNGAKLVENLADILVELAPQLELELPLEPAPADTDQALPHPHPAYGRLLNDMEFEPAAIDTLAQRCGLTAAELSSMLLVLELEGLVEALPGGRYCRLIKRSR